LGLLHMEIVQERLEREYNINLITTAPTVKYRITMNDGEIRLIENPSEMPELNHIEKIEEPMIRGSIYTPSEYMGAVIKLCEGRRGIQETINYITPTRCQVIYRMPLGEMVFDFYDRLKSSTKGYASFEYELAGLEESDLVKLDIMINGDPVDALSLIVHKSKAYDRGRDLTKKLKEEIPRQQFEIAIQAAIGSKIIARESQGALRKNVIAKCYGGDISRKRKLLEKQKEGKKRMKSIGSVDVPQEAFLAILKVE
jgi:GTP-binding protein LepA